MLPFEISGGTDKGSARSDNEDSYLIIVPEASDPSAGKGILLVVADGVGGAVAGKVASQTAVNIIRDVYYHSTETNTALALIEAFQSANRNIFLEAYQNKTLRGMATTCTAAVLKEYAAIIVHIGDSRAYRFREDKLTQLTEDHTIINSLVKGGTVTREAARNHPLRNLILKAMGSHDKIDPDVYYVELIEHDIIMLCSDGLYSLVNDHEISDTVKSLPLIQAVSMLIKLANERGGKDNITMLLAQHLSSGKE